MKFFSYPTEYKRIVYHLILNCSLLLFAAVVMVYAFYQFPSASTFNYVLIAIPMTGSAVRSVYYAVKLKKMRTAQSSTSEL
ncbi:TRAP-type C4-dicarboxylate transport system permease small subunit [Paenibacillus amylolyticus]|uniref:TRAP-type C4-dicarboxylate transport system permease small subunit n=1 Tax=Paenibacillus amylolyticus TaxID=1451 RepID=A0AAP5GYN8_PAEAM|nr:TRAP-type C4-dicarboxylate transport system permease small subunit [Paenibacillus amylolyticus]